ncbi:MAG: hypothetical protein QM648_12245 [Solirubrobacterales bacterium]
MSDRTPEEALILDLGSEDWYQLFELLQGSEVSVNRSDRTRALMHAMDRLLADGLVCICFAGDTPGEADRLSNDAARIAVRVVDNWSTPSKPQRRYWFTNTQRGDDEYFSDAEPNVDS